MASLVNDWLEVIDSYYLQDFIVSGGSAFKLALLEDVGLANDALGELRRKSEERNCLYVQISAAETRIDRIDQMFFAISRQIDWNALMLLDGVRFLKERGYDVPPNTELSEAEAIAEANGLLPEDLLKELRLATKQEIVEDREMCKEFRTVLSQLRKAQFFPRNVSPSDAETISSWLSGERVFDGLKLVRSAAETAALAERAGRAVPEILFSERLTGERFALLLKWAIEQPMLAHPNWKILQGGSTRSGRRVTKRSSSRSSRATPTGSIASGERSPGSDQCSTPEI